jgi:protein-disulfide isomerase
VTNARVTREGRQQKVAEMRAQAARAEARRRSMIVTGVVVLVIALIVAIFVIVQNTKHENNSTGGSTPTGFNGNNGVVVGNASAPVTVIAYEDFQCPVCRQFEQANSAQLDAWVKAGTVKIEYRMISFLDRSSTTNYSTRALNAAAALVTLKPSAFATFHKELYNNQPAEGTAGLTDKFLLGLAVQAGAPEGPMKTAIDDESYKAWTVRVTDASSKAGVNATPTVKVNGKELTDNDPATLKAAVDAAVAAAKK